MKQRFILFRRNGTYYCEDTETRQQLSLRTRDEAEARGKAFIRRRRLAKVSGVSLHSYRYAWAQRARQAGYPERFAQEALGHNSKAVHHAYAKNAQVSLPSLEEYERGRSEKIINLPTQNPSQLTQAAVLTA